MRAAPTTAPDLPQIHRPRTGRSGNPEIHAPGGRRTNPARLSSRQRRFGCERLTQYGKQGIRANTVLPGFIATPGTLRLPENFKQVLTDNILTPEFGGPEAIGSPVAYLLSDEARYLQGQEILVYGGMNTHVVQLAYTNTKTGALTDGVSAAERHQTGG